MKAISTILCILGILFGFSFGDKRCYGDIILRCIGLKPWSGINSGMHYTIFYSLIFFISAFVIRSGLRIHRSETR